MNKIKVRTPAKINLTLEVLNRRSDGFHNIQSIMHSINLYDYLTFIIEPFSGLKIELTGNSENIPYDESNLVYKAAMAFFNKAAVDKVKLKVYIEKHIPVSAGLAGGSANAAGTLFALNKLYNNILAPKELKDLCASLGSDINFCLRGGCALCTSRGEIIEPLPCIIKNVLLIKPKNLAISAKEAYTRFSYSEDKSNPDNTSKLKKLLLEGKCDETLFYNSLEKVLLPYYKELRDVKKSVEGSVMSGSGSAFFTTDSKLKITLDRKNYDIFENLTTIKTGVEEIND